jgi:hypothetical protein
VDQLAGAQWRNEVQVGGQTLITTSLFQPLDAAHRFFVEPARTSRVSIEDVFFDDERIARYQFEDLAAQLDVGLNVGRYAQARNGYRYDSRQVEVDIGSPLMPEVSPVDAGIGASVEFDSRDTAFSPTRGLAAALDYMQSDPALGADRHWERAELGVGVAVPLRRDVLWVSWPEARISAAICLPIVRSHSAGREFSPAWKSASCAWAVTGPWVRAISGRSGTSCRSETWRCISARGSLPARSTIASTKARAVTSTAARSSSPGRTLVGPLTVGTVQPRPTRGVCGSAWSARRPRHDPRESIFR